MSDEYITLAMRTESVDKFAALDPRVLHATYGIVTEVGELLLMTDDVNFVEEVGDICWYLAIVCDHWGVTFDELALLADDQMAQDDPRVLLLCATDMMDLVKRASFYGKELDEVRFVRLAATLYVSLAKMTDIERAKGLNIAKLKKRYPDGFDTLAATVRDLDGEREVLNG